MSAKREYHPARFLVNHAPFYIPRPLINRDPERTQGKAILLGCLFEVEGGELEMVVTGAEIVVTGGETVVTGRQMVVTGEEIYCTVLGPSGETVVVGGSSEEETGCRLVEIDALSS